MGITAPLILRLADEIRNNRELAMSSGVIAYPFSLSDECAACIGDMTARASLSNALTSRSLKMPVSLLTPISN
jgi:hypothetical protein